MSTNHTSNVHPSMSGINCQNEVCPQIYMDHLSISAKFEFVSSFIYIFFIFFQDVCHLLIVKL